jgi:hypothetical protein
MSDDETFEIPLQDQRVFGAGIKRKRVKFVPSSSSSVTPLGNPSAKSMGDLYLSLVLPKEAPSAGNTPLPSTDSAVPSTLVAINPPEPELCEICNLPFSSADSPAISTSSDQTSLEPTDTSVSLLRRPRRHEASLAHQVCLSHSHPPSHLDRKRKGLTYLSAYGWDPDTRLGLGPEGQGIRFPIKTKPKDDKLGIGVVLPTEDERRRKDKVEKLDAGKVRKMYDKDKRKGEKLREMFYRNEDVERYLGGG